MPTMHTRPAPTSTSTSTSPTLLPPPRTLPPYPSKLLIYHAGIRIPLLASLKASTLFLSAFCLTVAGPAVAAAAAESGVWGFAGVALAGSVPLGFMQYLSPPYVTHVYLHLPARVRVSHEMLRQYAKRLPGSAVLDLATMRTLGRPKVTTVCVEDLAFTKKRLGCVNWEWRDPGTGGKRKERRDFYVEQMGSPAKVPVAGVIEDVAKAIRLRAVRDARGSAR